MIIWLGEKVSDSNPDSNTPTILVPDLLSFFLNAKVIEFGKINPSFCPKMDSNLFCFSPGEPFSALCNFELISGILFKVNCSPNDGTSKLDLVVRTTLDSRVSNTFERLKLFAEIRKCSLDARSGCSSFRACEWPLECERTLDRTINVR